MDALAVRMAPARRMTAVGGPTAEWPPAPPDTRRAPGERRAVGDGVEGRPGRPSAPADPDLAVFVGQFSWTPDADAAEWLVQAVLPLLPRRIRVKLVGRSTEPRVRAPAGAEGLEDLAGLGLVLAEAPEAFAHAIAELSAAPRRADALGAAGRDAVIARYEWGPLGRRSPERHGVRLGSS